MAKKGKGFFGAVGSFLGSIPVVKSAKKAAKSVKKKIKKAKKKLEKALKKAKKKLKKKLGKVLTKARKLKNNLSKSKLVKKIKKAVKKAVKKAKKYVKKVVKTVKKAAKTAVKAVKKAAKTAVKAVKKAAKTTVKAVKKAAKTTVKAVKKAAKTTVKAVKSGTKTAVKAVKTATKTAVKVAKSATKKAAVFVKSVSISQAISTAADFIPVVGNAKAVFETVFGFDPITREKLSAVDRGISAAGILGGGYAKAAGKGGKTALNLFSNSKNATNVAESAAKSSKNSASVAKGDIPKGTDKNTTRVLKQDEAIDVARKKLAQERAELLNGKYIDPNTNDIHIPHVITAAVDMKTGKTYTGYNGVGTDLRTGNPRFNPTASDLHDDTKKLVEKTKQRAMEKEGKDSFERWEVENCAEIQAVNQAFKEGAKLEDIILSTISTKNGKYKEMCGNCKVTFEEFIVDIPFGKK